MFRRTYGLNAVKVALSPPGGYFHLFAAGALLRHQRGYISGLLSRCVSRVVREVARGGPKPDRRGNIRDKCS